MTDSAAAANRKYFFATMIVFGALLVPSCAVVWFLYAAFQGALQSSAQRGAAHIFLRGPFGKRFAVAATFDVPPSTELVHSEPSLQFDLIQRSMPANPFEAGIIRSQRNGGRLSGFVNFVYRGGPFIHYLAPLSDGPHRVAIVVEGDRLVVSIDGRDAYRLRDATFFPTSPGTISVGTYVALRDEKAAGSIVGLELRREGEPRARAILSACSVGTHGLSLRRVASGWALAGTNDLLAAPSQSDCSA